MYGVRIVDFESKHKDAVIRMGEGYFPETHDGLETIRDSFQIISDFVDGKLSIQCKAQFSEQEKVNLDEGLDKYVVALDDSNRVVGVSGLYSVTQGYLEKLGVSLDEEKGHYLEDPNNLFLGWTFVDKNMTRQGIGTELIKGILVKAASFLKEKKLDDTRLVVVADKEAVGFYEKLGMKLDSREEYFDVYSISVKELAKNVGSHVFEHMETDRQAGNVRHA